MDKLKLCSFCGDDAELFDLAGWEIVCKCGALMVIVEYSLPDDQKVKVIHAWNKRAAE